MASQDLGDREYDQAVLRHREAFVLLRKVDRGGINRLELLESPFQHRRHALGSEIVDIADEIAGCVDDVQPLQSAALTDDLAGEIALGVLAPAGAVVGDTDTDEMRLEHVHDLGIVEGRRTEGHNVVSATAERFAARDPDKYRLLGFGRGLPAFEDRDMPRNGPPQLIFGWL